MVLSFKERNRSAVHVVIDRNSSISYLSLKHLTPKKKKNVLKNNFGKEDKVRGLTLPDVKIYKPRTNKTMWYCH